MQFHYFFNISNAEEAINIKTAFLHADNDETIIMKLRGKMVELIVKLEPSMYQKYVTKRPKGEPILHVKLLNALYGLLRSVLLLKKG